MLLCDRRKADGKSPRRCWYLMDKEGDESASGWYLPLATFN